MYKNVACSESGILLFQEIQRGKVAMHKKKYFSDVGATAACSLRLIEGAQFSGEQMRERLEARKNNKRHVVFADSWFGSVKLAECLKLVYSEKSWKHGKDEFKYKIKRGLGENPNGHEIVCAIKSNCSLFPKKELENKMEKWPSGSYLVLECTTPGTNVDLVALGYKYNARKTLCFVMTKNAGATSPGATPYIAKWPDKYRNVLEREIPRPDVISNYFRASNKIDVHNHLRQSLLGLERFWTTRNPWFRYDCTIIGQTLIDAYKAIQHYEPTYDCTVEDFADGVANDCVKNTFSTDVNVVRRHIIPDAPMPNGLEHIQMNNIREEYELILSTPTSSISHITDGTFFSGPCTVIGEHGTIPIPEKSKARNQENRSVKRKCVICKMDTRKMCNNYFCKKKESRAKGKVYHGTWICDESRGPRNIAEYGGTENTKTCMQIHRELFQAPTNGANEY